MKRESSRSALFLMELLLSILFFALTSAVCVRLFAASHLVSARSRDESAAVTQAQSAAAVLQSEAGDIEKAAALLSGQAADGVLTVYYDADWQPCAAGDGVCRLTAAPDDEKVVITVTRLRDSLALFTVTPVCTPLPTKTLPRCRRS